MSMTPPKWYEIVIGTALLVSAVWLGWHLVHHPEHEHLYAWGFVGGMSLTGLWLVSPVRAQALWREVRDLIPWTERER